MSSSSKLKNFAIKNRQLLFYGAIAAFLALVVLFAQANRNTTLEFGSRTLSVEKVKSEHDRARGLGGRESIADDYAMLFVYEDSGEHCFWMKDMNFPIDIIWLDEMKKVIYIAAYVPPESYPSSFCPPTEARYVLEVRAGLSDEASVDVGTQLQL